MSIQRGCSDRASIGISECFSNVFLPLCSGIFRWFSIFKFICSSRWFTFSVGSDKHLKRKSGELKQQQSEKKKKSAKNRKELWVGIEMGRRRRRGRQEDRSNATSARSKNFEIFPSTVRRQEKSFAANVALLSSAQPPSLHWEMHFAELFGNAQLVSFSRESSVSPLTGENFHIFPILPPILGRTRAKMCNMPWTLCKPKRRVTVSKFNDQWAFTTCKCSLHSTHHRAELRKVCCSLPLQNVMCCVLGMCARDVHSFSAETKKNDEKTYFAYIRESEIQGTN